MDYESIFSIYKQQKLHGRYITLDDITPLLQQANGKLDVAGYSVNNEPIFTLTIGSGSTKVLLWSQMHGNESTATKALFDIFNFLESNDNHAQQLLQNITFCFVPMLNPDGAKLYTRENAATVDLNRDFTAYTQPESRWLKSLFDAFKPDYCFNLHDQRTIFGAGNSGLPATVSFLAPAFNDARDWNECRISAALIINQMNNALQQKIPGQVGRFDDSFNANCVGDSFQSFGVPTILIEAGHFQQDYEREVTRMHFFGALIAGFDALCSLDANQNGITEYLNIPENKVVFYDFVYKNVRINYDGKDIITNFAVQYNEALENGKIVFKAAIAAIGDLHGRFGHITLDADGDRFYGAFSNDIVINSPADFKLGTREFKNGLPV